MKSQYREVFHYQHLSHVSRYQVLLLLGILPLFDLATKPVLGYGLISGIVALILSLFLSGDNLSVSLGMFIAVMHMSWPFLILAAIIDYQRMKK